MKYFRRKKLIIALNELHLNNLKGITATTKYHRVEFLLKAYSRIRNKMESEFEKDNVLGQSNQLTLF